MSADVKSEWILKNVNIFGSWVLLSGHSEAAFNLLQGRGKPCTTQCASVLSGGGHRHGKHQSVRPLQKVGIHVDVILVKTI